MGDQYHGPERRGDHDNGMVVPLKDYLEKEIDHVKQQLAADILGLRVQLHDFRAESAQDHAAVIADLGLLRQDIAGLQRTDLTTAIGQQTRTATYGQIVKVVLAANLFAGALFGTIFLLIDKL